MPNGRAIRAGSAMRWQQDPYDQPDDDDQPGDLVPDDDRLVPVEQTRPPFDARWRAMFTPEAPERLTAYWTATRLSYIDLLGELAELGREQARGDIDPLTAAHERISLMQTHLGETARLAEVFGVAA